MATPTSVQSSNGPALGGNLFTITKAGLGSGTDITNVTICGVSATIQSQTADSVTVITGAGGSGLGNVVVHSAGYGATTLTNGYTYNPPGVVAEVVPNVGLLAGGTTVVINGSNLGQGDVTSATLCDAAATIIADHSPTQLVVSTGAGTNAIWGHVTIYSASYGTTTKSNAFGYQATLTAAVDAHGNIAPQGDIVLPPNGNTNFVITAASYYHLAAVYTNGTTLALTNPTNVTFVWSNVISDGAILASFTENLATNAAPEWWLHQYFPASNNFNAAALSDTDGDGLSAWQERLAGTDPTNRNSCLVISNAVPQTNSLGFQLRWPAVPSQTYLVQYADSLAGPWKQDLPNAQLTAGAGQSTLTYTDTSAATSRVYRVQTGTVASPNAVGYLTIQIPPAGGYALCGLNFMPQGKDPATLLDLLGTNQLARNNLYTLANQVHLWDPARSNYLSVFQKPNGNFYLTSNTSQSTNPSVGVGQAFWIQSPKNASAARTVLLAGEILADPITDQQLPPSMTLIANPYLAPFNFNDTNLYWVADGATAHNLYTLADQVSIWTNGAYINLYLRAADQKWHYQSGGQLATNAIIPPGGGAWYKARKNFTNLIVRPYPWW